MARIDGIGENKLWPIVYEIFYVDIVGKLCGDRWYICTKLV